jgi:hypothetical protein
MQLAAAGASVGAAEAPAPVSTMAWMLGLVQGRAAVAGTIVILTGAASAPASRQWLSSVTGWGQTPVLVKSEEPKSPNVEPLLSKATKGSGRSSSLRSISGMGGASVPEPGATLLVSLVAGAFALRRRR